MILRNCGINEFQKKLIDKECIVFGAGGITDAFMKKSPQIVNSIKYIVDNFKAGETYSINNKEFVVRSADILQTVDMHNKIVLICSVRRYAEIIEQLDAISNLNNTEGYVSFFMGYAIEKRDNAEILREIVSARESEMKIPKIIHCFWFSKDPKPELHKRCLESWNKYCPDYKIIEWNADNYDVNKHIFMEQAFEKRKWAFVSDYARLDVLYQYGGIYLDLDVEIIKNFDSLLYQDAFFSFHSMGNIDLGSGFGAVKNHPLVRRLLDSYEDAEFLNERGEMDDIPQPARLRPIFEKFGLVMDGAMQKIGNNIFYPTDYFSPIDFLFYDLQKTSNTYSIHHYDDGWHNKKQAQEKIERREKARKYLSRIKA